MTGENAVRISARFICSAAAFRPWRMISVVTGSTRGSRSARSCALPPGDERAARVDLGDEARRRGRSSPSSRSRSRDRRACRRAAGNRARRARTTRPRPARTTTPRRSQTGEGRCSPVRGTRRSSRGTRTTALVVTISSSSSIECPNVRAYSRSNSALEPGGIRGDATVRARGGDRQRVLLADVAHVEVHLALQPLAPRYGSRARRTARPRAHRPRAPRRRPAGRGGCARPSARGRRRAGPRPRSCRRSAGTTIVSTSSSSAISVPKSGPAPPNDDERRLARIATLLDRDAADRIGHRRRRDVQRAAGDVRRRVESEPAGERRERRLGTIARELDAARELDRQHARARRRRR